MKVLIVAALQEFGGVEKTVPLIANVCSEEKYNVDIVTLNYISNISSTKSELSSTGIKITSLYEFYYKTFFGKISYLLANLKFLLKNKKLPAELIKYNFCSIKSKNYRKNFWINKDGKKLLKQSDLIILVGQPINDYSPILKYAKTEMKTVVFRLTGSVFPEYKDNAFYKKFLQEINVCKTISVHSASNKKAVEEILGYTGNIEVIDQYAEQENALLKMKKFLKNKEVIEIGTLSRLSNEKRVKDLLFSLSKLEKKEKIHLSIAGDGPEKEALVNLTSELGLENIVSFLGYIKEKEVLSFFDNLDIFVITSSEEAGPITGVEAMAAGPIIISTRVGAMPERLEGMKNSLFYDSCEIKQLEDKLHKVIELISSNEAQKISENLKELYVKNQSKSYIIKKYACLINTVIL